MSTLVIILISVGILAIIGISIYYAAKTVEEENIIYPAPTIKSEASEIELRLLNEINKYRTDNGKTPVVYNPVLSLACETHVIKCYRDNKISHEGHVERFSDLQEMYPVVRITELVSYGYTTAKGALNGFKSSSLHNENLLNNFNKIGISALPDNKGKHYICIILAKIINNEEV